MNLNEKIEKSIALIRKDERIWACRDERNILRNCGIDSVFDGEDSLAIKRAKQ